MTAPIFEIAEIVIDPSNAHDFEAAVTAAIPHFRVAPGCVSFALHRSFEQAGGYRLVVGWASVEAHTVDFRNSDGFQRWRELVGGFFTSPPVVTHVVEVITGLRF